MSEIILLGIIALIVIGPKELPELARTLGRFLNELKRSTNTFSEDLKQQARIDRINFNEPNQPPPPPPTEALHPEEPPKDPKPSTENDPHE